MIKGPDQFRFIIDQFRTCWCILNPVGFSNAPIKDLSILNRADAAFNSKTGDSVPAYEDWLPQEIDKDIMSLEINIVHPGLRNDNVLESHHINRRYIKAVQQILAKKASEFGWVLSEEFVVEYPLVLSNISREKIVKLSEYLIKQGFISKDDQQSLIGCFNNTLNVPEKKIVWRDTNVKTHEPAFASLYWLFKTLGLEMASDNKDKIASLFCLQNGDPIKGEAIKARKKSGKLSKFVNEIERILQ